ncbi:MAG: DUF5916 domain-containing protein [Bacteroidota bacterium]
MKSTGVILAALLGIAPALEAAPADTASTPRPVVHAVRALRPIAVDGVLTEDVWRTAPAWNQFVQRDPDEGEISSEKTEVRVAYDDAALYVGARMFDSAPDSILALLGRRDAYCTCDYFVLYLDPYFDRRSGFYFGLDAAGTYYDGVLTNDEWTDESWDGVWEGKVRHDSEGWTAEMRIPFSQLRFQETNAWGINFERSIARKHEEVYLVFTPKDGSGFVSRFADLRGIERITPPSRFEALPYVTAKAEYTSSHPGDPFNNGKKYTPGFGADFKVGIGTNLTLDATVNPDFGQVEVDPAVVNLSDVETFFSERRPFFIEGASIFSFGQRGARSYWGFNWSTPDLFYSRRIGRAPQGSIPEADFVGLPAGTRIIGAAKLSGQFGDNWSVGTIQSVTAREYADLSTNGVKFRAEIEPLTYYGVLRGLKQFGEGMQGLGLLGTYTARMFNDDRLRDELNRDAITGGIDGWTFLDADKVWVISGSVMGSYVHGTPTRMLEVQTNSQHYFQRPDADHVSVDSTATSLTGYATRFWLNKQKGNVIFNGAFGAIHPSFETNDLGFLRRTDMINFHAGGGYKWVEPTSLYRRADIIAALFRTYDYGGNITWEGVFSVGEFQFPNYMSLEVSGAYNPETINNSRTRGGPLTLNPWGYQVDMSFETDNRQILVAGLFGGTYKSDWTRGVFGGTQLEWKPSSNINLRFGPELEVAREYAQWIGVWEDPTATHTYGSRYVFGKMDQKTLSANIRINWTFTPKLSLQVFLQPLISTGDFSEFKELAQPRTFDFNVYGTGESTIEYQGGEYVVDPDGPGPAETFSFSDPDYHVVSLRGNAVLRWEYLPGSVLYLVWTQSRGESNTNAQFQVDRSLREMMNTHPDNIFMIKLTYWWSL